MTKGSYQPRGNSTDRRRRHQWLIDTYGPAIELVFNSLYDDPPTVIYHTGKCRCYSCGKLLTVDTVTADRIIPGRDGGTYKRENIRPACKPCQDRQGGQMRRKTALT